MEKQILSFDYPNGTKYTWDNVEVDGVKEENGNISVTHDNDADFWSVYLRAVDGGVMCVADLPTEKHAQDLATLLRNATRSYKENGYMTVHTQIEWKDMEYAWKKTVHLEGFVNGQLMFTIDQEGTRKPKYCLKSYPFQNEVFTRANVSKVLLRDIDLEFVKRTAQMKLDAFVKLFLK